MHRSFADWYTQVLPPADGPTLNRRWNSIESFATALQLDCVPDVLRMFYSRPASPESKEQLRKAAKVEDDTFLMDRDDAELSILSAGVIARVVASGPDPKADALAIGVSCMEALGLRRTGRIQGVVDDASVYLATQAVRARQTAADRFHKLETPALTAALKAIRAGAGELGTLAAAVEGAIQTLVSSLDDQYQVLASAVGELQRREQTDILWWLYGEYTLDRKLAFADMNVGEACFLGARDLANLTKVLPGPAAARAFLKKMLKSTAVPGGALFTIKDVVDDFYPHRRDWDPPAGINDLADCCPLSFASAKCLESAGGCWADAFSARTGLGVDEPIAADAIAFQIYQELLFIRCLERQPS
jgi:hypothetical protein